MSTIQSWQIKAFKNFSVKTFRKLIKKFRTHKSILQNPQFQKSILNFCCKMKQAVAFLKKSAHTAQSNLGLHVHISASNVCLERRKTVMISIFPSSWITALLTYLNKNFCLELAFVHPVHLVLKSFLSTRYLQVSKSYLHLLCLANNT